MKRLLTFVAATALSLGLATAAMAGPHHGHGGGYGGGYGGYGYGAGYGLPFGFGAVPCVDPATGQAVLCPVSYPFLGYGLGGYGYGRGHRHH